jgi:hypothetical protein
MRPCVSPSFSLSLSLFRLMSLALKASSETTLQLLDPIEAAWFDWPVSSNAAIPGL